MTSLADESSASAGSARSSIATTRPEPRIVTFGGGTGMAALLRGLKEYTTQITAVVTVTDNGGSSGRLRNEFDIAAPGDIRNCLLALADVDPVIASAFQYRFDEAEFKGHCFGNLFITVLTRVMGGFERSIRELNRLLRVKGMVVPAADQKVSLVAHHPDGTKSTGEVEITKSRKPIRRVELRPYPIRPSPEILGAIREADLFLFGPGSLYTSVIPNLLLEGLMDAINATGRPRVYISNIMTQPGETKGYKLGDHVRALRDHVGSDFPDTVLVHTGAIPSDIIQKYQASGADPVESDVARCQEFGVQVIQKNFFAEGEPEDKNTRGGERTAGAVRHDSKTLGRVINEQFLMRLSDERRRDGKPEGASSTNQVSAGTKGKTAVSAHGTRTLP